MVGDQGLESKQTLHGMLTLFLLTPATSVFANPSGIGLVGKASEMSPRGSCVRSRARRSAMVKPSGPHAVGSSVTTTEPSSGSGAKRLGLRAGLFF